MNTIGYAAESATAALAPYSFERRDLRSNDVAIDIQYCGVCHSDLHTVRNDWGGTTYPIVPGHEIVGKVTDVGSDVTKYKVGDIVAVGCMVDSCQQCDQCHKGEEQFCREGMVGTYSGTDRITGESTKGGYSKHIRVREEFVLSVPDSLDTSRVAPLLCAGITTYSPLKHWGVKAGSRVGVIGLGGLGHMALKIAKAMGASVTVLGRSDEKKEDARALGADEYLISTNDDAMEKARNSFDVIINTIPVKHDVTPYMPLLDIDGSMVIVGQVGPLQEPSTVPMLMGRRQVGGSLIGGIAETQEMLDFCAEHNVLPECEMIAMQDINDAFDRLEKADVHYRFVIDMSSLSTAS
ncbi:NAD(P)-dependent alcohol dehydrogenase [Alteromonas pelagimontana]|uniref:NAD(P)-dependent alcohol dehydrogenase n=1 Tax=Alteromonas pelagimontana TaxID=1858656 RepID=A0A6M4MH73_9ALTE|nr:NAD(P)-dependent alcohol dehydrogenase [Alteromonas pelagimontana]QJR81940.1 NAD(P)-dependent alcohol dehydrogenase [Alteromonas pelagimontana]